MNPLFAVVITLAATSLAVKVDSLDLLILGDWGNQANYPNMLNVASAMDIWAATYNSTAVLALGDNFYKGGNYSYDGVQSVDDPKFTTLWKDVFNGTTLKTLPWWIILGNHDWYLTNSQTYELEYEHINWKATDFFYTKRILVDLDSQTYASFIFIETDLLFYGYNSTKNDLGVNFALQGWTANTYLQQLAWIDNALAEANNDPYVFVVGHHPTFTCGSDVTSSLDMIALDNLVNKWVPTAYLNGHHHTLAYYYVNNGSTLQIQSGAGGTVPDTVCAPYENATGQELSNINGFTHLHVTADLAKFEFVTEFNVLVFNASLPPRTPVVGVFANTTYLPAPGDPSIHWTNPLLANATSSTTSSSATTSTTASGTTTAASSTTVATTATSGTTISTYSTSAAETETATLILSTTNTVSAYVAPSAVAKSTQPVNLYSGSARLASIYGCLFFLFTILV
ncbi:Tartrate-resistant acid phosphatase type 5 [Physocladia obscura]|uniref:Tartrate-resistant acid phosphatase type 5 n=1 Tax=Physocladia obscura TaxID=109957 RepID=A0AAD5SY80_9FUNG|nr:Tartrate-resistant acid phosphatase type 5 [Physocladia obscura]